MQGRWENVDFGIFQGVEEIILPRLELQTAGRQFRRQFGAAIRGNLIRALTELITNSDDSYRRLEKLSQPGCGRIEVYFDRVTRQVAVVDQAEGMDAEDMARMYPQYGAATSGLYEHQNVRGYFGKGIKDVMFSMEHGKVFSIKNDLLYTAGFVWDEDRPIITITDQPESATPKIRQSLGIPAGNGTRVSFTIPRAVRLPRHESLLKSLSNFYMLRLINSNKQRCITLYTRSSKKKRQENRIQYRFPQGEMVMQESFQPSQDWPVKADLWLYRAESSLTQSGEDREGGILIFDEQGAVLDLTLFGYDREELASHIFGLMQLNSFRELLRTEENVLTDTRDGLDRHHPFTQALAGKVESHLKTMVERERHARLESPPQELSQRQEKRLGTSIDRINALLTNMTSLNFEMGEPGEELTRPPEGGIEFRPKSVRLNPRCKTAIRLLVDTSIIPPGTEVSVTSSSRVISCQPETFQVLANPGKLVFTQQVILNSNRIGNHGEVTASANGFQSAVQVKVVPEAYPRPEGGLAFIPDVLRLANNSRRRANLYAHESVVRPGNTIHFKLDSTQVEAGLEHFSPQPDDFRDGVARIQVPLKGTGIGSRATLVATAGEQEASLVIEVVSKTEKRRRSSTLLTGYRFDQSTPSRVRASYDDETGLIWVYLQNPIVQRYFGNLPLEVALNTPHCQILLAEIVLEQVAWVARRKMLETGAAMYMGSNHTEEDLTAVRQFMSEYGDKIHSWIADDQIIDQAVENLAERFALQKEEGNK